MAMDHFFNSEKLWTACGINLPLPIESQFSQYLDAMTKAMGIVENAVQGLTL